ncbi:hypothetical protein SADUNF_Sadunf19G0115300 [Salix dunnii]|uniref:Uncharacterized protein n=1 Tax=Salix dunnii TaxID=1413687 RepID=A0A835J4H8_9ROSI|nr:hypothetical protein SADUNF_Sadunf19G0115300 [Salix dunnii]
MKPESLLPQRKSMDRLLKFPMEAGIKPVRLFCCRLISLSMVMFPIEEGMGPESLLLQRLSMDRFLKFPMDAGIKPMKGWDQRAGFEKGEAKISFSSFQLNSGFYRLKH